MGNWEEECLLSDPFEGDYGGSGSNDGILSDKIVTCRKSATCHLCCGEVKPATRIRRRTEVYDGDLMRFAWCEECCRAMASQEYDDDGRSPLDYRVAIGERARELAHAEQEKQK